MTFLVGTIILFSLILYLALDSLLYSRSISWFTEVLPSGTNHQPSIGLSKLKGTKNSTVHCYIINMPTYCKMPFAQQMLIKYLWNWTELFKSVFVSTSTSTSGMEVKDAEKLPDGQGMWLNSTDFSFFAHFWRHKILHPESLWSLLFSSIGQDGNAFPTNFMRCWTRWSSICQWLRGKHFLTFYEKQTQSSLNQVKPSDRAEG